MASEDSYGKYLESIGNPETPFDYTLLRYGQIPAFPTGAAPGMSLREYFVASAIQGLAGSSDNSETIARQAVALADAVLAELLSTAAIDVD